MYNVKYQSSFYVGFKTRPTVLANKFYSNNNNNNNNLILY